MTQITGHDEASDSRQIKPLTDRKYLRNVLPPPEKKKQNLLVHVLQARKDHHPVGQAALYQEMKGIPVETNRNDWELYWTNSIFTDKCPSL